MCCRVSTCTYIYACYCSLPFPSFSLVLHYSFSFCTFLHSFLFIICYHIYFTCIHIHLYRLSACCVHVSALLHALVALTPDLHCSKSNESSDEEAIPCTSMLCQWKPPCKRKATAQLVSTANFQKHEYGKIKKIQYTEH